MTNTHTAISGLALAAVLLGGCASMFMDGSEPHEGFPDKFEARYTAPSCRVLATNQPIAGPPGMTWFIVSGEYGPRLLELDVRGEGAAITNSWRDEHGDYYFTKVAAQGWVYAFPRDESKTPARYVYAGGGFAAVERAGVLLPLGQPLAVCEMVKQ